MLKKIHHVGIVVRSIATAYALYRDTLSLPVHKEDIIQDQGVKAALLTIGASEIELLEPLTPGTGVARFLTEMKFWKKIAGETIGAEIAEAAIVLPLMIVASVCFGAAWAAVPAYLQAYRGSHIVITTIMFNFIAGSLLVYLLVNVLKAPGGMAVESAPFPPAAHLPTVQEALASVGIEWPSFQSFKA